MYLPAILSGIFHGCAVSQALLATFWVVGSFPESRPSKPGCPARSHRTNPSIQPGQTALDPRPVCFAPIRLAIQIPVLLTTLTLAGSMPLLLPIQLQVRPQFLARDRAQCNCQVSGA